MSPSVDETLVLIRARYPDALVCVRCARLLATQAASYRLSDAARLVYVCFECRQDEAQAERMRLVRLANLGRANRDINPPPESLPEFSETPAADPPQTGQSSQVDITAQRKRHVGGRPRKHSDRRDAVRSANRAYRERKRTPPT